MENVRIYGNEPFKIVVVHGFFETMAPVARELSEIGGVLEPLQTARTLEGQIEELKNVLDESSDLPIILIGHSGGACLAYMFTAKYPTYVKKLVLLGNGPYEDKYIPMMNEVRANRYSEEDKARVGLLMHSLGNPATENRHEVLKEFGKIMSRADSYKPIAEGEELNYHPDTFLNIMKEVTLLRQSGDLLELGKNIDCPVIAIHGDYESFQGVEETFAPIVKDFRYFLLENCGHSPWNEELAKNRFYEIVRDELQTK